MVTPLQQDESFSATGPRFIKRLNHNAGTARVKDGLGIAPLRATSGPPGVSQTSSAAQAEPSPGLFDLPDSGEGILSSLASQTKTSSPLTASLTDSSQDPPALHLLQAAQLNLRHHLQQSDNQSRLLQASANPRRTQGGFALQFSATSFDLLA